MTTDAFKMWFAVGKRIEQADENYKEWMKNNFVLKIQ